MLMDLSKDIMMDLGITVIGDIIAILKHAKQVYRQVRNYAGISCGYATFLPHVNGFRVTAMLKYLLYKVC